MHSEKEANGHTISTTIPINCRVVWYANDVLFCSRCMNVPNAWRNSKQTCWTSAPNWNRPISMDFRIFEINSSGTIRNCEEIKKCENYKCCINRQIMWFELYILWYPRKMLLLCSSWCIMLGNLTSPIWLLE